MVANACPYGGGHWRDVNPVDDTQRAFRCAAGSPPCRRNREGLRRLGGGSDR